MATRHHSTSLSTAIKGTALALAMLTLAACAAPSKVLTISSNPLGAVLVEDGTGHMYQTPVTLQYPADMPLDENGCMHVRPFRAIWASQTTLMPPAGPLRLCGQYDSWTMTIERPREAPGLDIDLAEARARQRQIEAQAMAYELQRRQGEAALAQGFATLGYGVGCAAGGGCGQDGGSVPYYAPRSTGDYPPSATAPEVPPWALKRDALDTGTVCSVDSWGRTYCGLKQ